MIDFDILNFDDNITDEQLAAYIDGNATTEETLLIENALNNDTMLSEVLDVVQDGASLGSDFDWELYKGNYGFWELGLPPAVTEEDLSIAADTPTDDTTSFNEGTDLGLDLDSYTSLGKDLPSLDDSTSDDILGTDDSDEWNGSDDLESSLF